ncbi:MAG: sulfatase-like hydrolase/transferase, partial [Akkermansiaceae bacterium]|nr:sulfatase-like hydrolase/transferase [Akkermansiaceae bacterium]
MHRKLFILITSILCCFPIVSGNQPNVVLIISDDAGYADFGFMNEVTNNTTDILTPQLDTLRSGGSLCSVAYTGAVCSPSRGSILSGSYQQRVGYFYNINNALDPADGPDGFANEEVIAFERMKTAGYKTLAVGKWHVGAQADTLNSAGNKVLTPGNRPPRQGVDHFFGMLSGSRDYDVPMDDHAFGSYEYRQRGLREMSPGNKDDSLANDVDEEQNSKWAGDVTDAFGTRAREYVTEHANKDYPFFLYVAFNAPHTPMYESSDYALLNDPSHPNYANFSSMSNVRKQYCSMVYTMDRNIGLLIDRLKDPNNDGNTSDSVYDNTLIIFINDNGGSKKNESVNIPLRGDKGDPHDGGCRVPMLVAGPGITNGSTYDKPIHSMDLIPTMLAHGGSSIPTELMGSNLLDRFKGSDTSIPHDYICVAGNNGLGLRKNEWKLVIDGSDDQYLYNTSTDVGETNDLAGSEPAKLDELIRDVTNFDVQMDKPRFPPKGGSHASFNYNYSFTFSPNDVTTPSGIDKIIIDYDDGDAGNGEHDNAVNNGGFETNTATAGNQGKFSQINQWTNLASSGQNINALRDNNTSPNGGGWNSVLSDANPTTKDFGLDTSHTLAAGENFTVSYAWLDGSNWVDSDKIRFQLFTTANNTITGTQTIIHTADSSSSTNRAYQTENFSFTAPSGVDGKTLFLRFYALDGNASLGFARVDNIFLGRLGSGQTETEAQFWASGDQ